MKTILLYTQSIDEESIAIENLLDDQYSMKFVHPKQLHHTLHNLLHEDFLDEMDNEVYDFKFLLLPKMEMDELNKVTGLLKDNNINIQRIAMQTEHNIHWTLHELIEEINREYAYFMLRGKLKSLWDYAMKVPLDTLADNETKDIKVLLVRVHEAIQSQETTMKDLENLYTTLLIEYRSIAERLQGDIHA